MKQYQVNPQAALMNWYVMLHLGHEGERQKLDQVSPLKEQLETIRMNYLATSALNQELNGYPVSEEMIETYFTVHRAQYEQAKIKAIYISFKPGAITTTGTSEEDLRRAAQQALAGATTERTEAQAAGLAAEVVRQLRTGADFDKLVAAYSDDPVSKAKGGDFGIVKPGSPYPEDFRKAVMLLDRGALSDPIRQPTGFYIVRIEEKGFPAVKDMRVEISEMIRQQHLTEWMQGLNARFNPVIKDPSFFAPKSQQPASPFSVTGR
jgi:hypothetical protein